MRNTTPPLLRATSPSSPSPCVPDHCYSNWFHFHWPYITMTFPFFIFVLQELLNFLLLSIEVSPSKTTIVCECSDSMNWYFLWLSRLNFPRLDYSRHKSLLVSKKYHSWFYRTFKVIENKMLIYLFQTLSSLRFINLHFVSGLFQKELWVS